MKHPDEEEPGRPTGEPPTEAARKKAVEEYANSLREFIRALRKRFNLARAFLSVRSHKIDYSQSGSITHHRLPESVALDRRFTTEQG
jgi:hypothetical protein